MMRETKIAESTSVKLTSCKSHQPLGLGGSIYSTGQRAAAGAQRGKWFIYNVLSSDCTQTGTETDKTHRGRKKLYIFVEVWKPIYARKKDGQQIKKD